MLVQLFKKDQNNRKASVNSVYSRVGIEHQALEAR